MAQKIKNPFADVAFDILEAETKVNGQTSADKQLQQKMLAALDALGRQRVKDDDLIFEGTKFVLPATMAGDIKGAAKYLLDYERQQETTFEFSKTYKFRPYDGANAFQNAMMRVFGTVGLGKSTFTFFGEQKPEMLTIDIGVGETTQVPFGRVQLAPLNATFTVGGMRDREFGVLFRLGVEAPRKHRARIEAFFAVVEDELRKNSIYKGKAINGAADPGFIDVFRVNPDRVVYSEDVLTQLDANLWTLIRHPATMRELGISLKRAVLLHGPYGTGKTMCGALTAQEAVRNGWTFILCRPGVDDLFDVLTTAQLYAPAVVWYEDIDILATGEGGATHISKLLDVLDGINAKGVDVLAGFTTNHVEKIQKGVLRPGRIDAIIPIEGLDAAGLQRLIRVLVPDNLLGTVDWPKVIEAFDGFLPTFIVEATSRAMRYTVARTGGVAGVIETEDLVAAANGLRPQLELMEGAKEGATAPTLDRAVTQAIERVLVRTSAEEGYDPFVVAPEKPGVSARRAD